MKYLSFFFVAVCVICYSCSCQRMTFAEYRLENIDSIHISRYEDRLKTYVCIKNQEGIDSISDIFYTSTTICLAHFYPNMEITFYGDNLKQVFGVSENYVKGDIGGESKYNIEEILENIYIKESKIRGF